MSTQYTPINILALPFVSFDERKKLPLTGGVYFVIMPEPERLCYIGKAQSLRSRWAGHHRAHQMMPTTRIHWLNCDDEQQRTALEDRLIAFYTPQWNGAMTTALAQPDLETRIKHLEWEVSALKAQERQHQAQWLHMCERETHFCRIEKALSHISDVARYMEVDRDELLARILTDWAYNRKEV
jgi:hypothetical protein